MLGGLALGAVAGLAALDAAVPLVPVEVAVVAAAARWAHAPGPAAALLLAAAVGSWVGQCAVFVACRRWAPNRFRHRGAARAGRWAPAFGWALPGGRLAVAVALAGTSVSTTRFAATAGVGAVLGAAYLVTVGALLHGTGGAVRLGVAAVAAVAALAVVVAGRRWDRGAGEVEAARPADLVGCVRS